MIDIKLLKNSGYFKEFHLESNEILFDEGEIDNNLYIVLAGEIKIEKYTTKKREETKVLAKLGRHEIIGESSLNNSKPKELRTVASRRTYLLSINAVEGLENFIDAYPNEGMNLLKYIIHISNKRLLKANQLVIAQYKITQEIQKLKEINNKNIFLLIDKIEEMIDVDFTIYVEKNPVIDGYLTIRYDSRRKGKMGDDVMEMSDWKLKLLEIQGRDNFYFSQPLVIGEDKLGYLVFFRRGNNFIDNDKKILSTISSGISGLIKEKKILEEERDKNYMEE